MIKAIAIMIIILQVYLVTGTLGKANELLDGIDASACITPDYPDWANVTTDAEIAELNDNYEDEIYQFRSCLQDETVDYEESYDDEPLEYWEYY